MSNINPFQKLIVDETQDVNMEELAELLHPFVVFVKNSQSMEFSRDFKILTNDLKILVILAASKAKASIFSTEEKMSQKDFINLELIPEGSVKNIIKKLFDEKEIKASDKKYYLPGYKVSALGIKLKNYKLNINK